MSKWYRSSVANGVLLLEDLDGVFDHWVNQAAGIIRTVAHLGLELCRRMGHEFSFFFDLSNTV